MKKGPYIESSTFLLIILKNMLDRSDFEPAMETPGKSVTGSEV
jgi:hypothetical protein